MVLGLSNHVVPRFLDISVARLQIAANLKDYSSGLWLLHQQDHHQPQDRQTTFRTRHA
jgi:hypothetical protein